MAFQEPPLLSIMTPLQLVLWTARTLGYGPKVMTKALERMTSKDRKPKVFAGYTPQASDVFITCFSKSGTNWCMQLVTQIAHRGAADFEHIHALVPWPDSSFPGIVSLDDPRPLQAAPLGLRGIKTAIEGQYVPYSPEAKYLSVIRDPKDVCVSAYEFLMGIFGMREHIDLTMWLDIVLVPGGLLDTWPGHLDSYWRWRERPNVLLLEFAEMKRSLPTAVDQLLALLEVELSEDERAEVIRRASFDYMKANESCFAPPRLRLLTGSERGKMVRSGKVGDSRQRLTPEQRERVDTHMLAGLERLGCDFPYAERFMSA